MNKINNILISIKNKLPDTILYNYISKLITDWFIRLNSLDKEFLIILATYLSYKINTLFIEEIQHDNQYINQYIQNNDQDLKAIVLLLLPYIKNDDTFKNIMDLDELLLTKNIKKNISQFDRNEILKSHFKYSNIGISLFDIHNKLNLVDNEFTKLIYKIIYHNFISIIDTLFIINGKLYINWINIFPITMNNYKNSIIYKKTITQLSDAVDNLINNQYINLLDYNGLYIGEFYNVYRNIYYSNIKNIKWLIFINNNTYYIQYLNSIFNFKLFFEFNAYSDLDILDKNDFKVHINNITSSEYTIWKNIILFMVNNYSKTYILNENIINPFKFSIQESKDNEFINIKKFNTITDKNVFFFLKNIDIEHIWNYIKESLSLFESTIYAYYLIYNKTITSFFYFNDTNIHLKNIYNIAKSLSHSNQKQWNLLPIKFSSLDITEKINFWNKYNLKYKTEIWLNIYSNLKLEYENGNNIYYTKKQYNIQIQDILLDFNKIKNDLVWEYLIYNGILSEFKINNNNTLNINNLSYYNDAYYFLTNKKYSKHRFIILDKQKNIGLENNYLNTLTNYKWYTFYAMNWINQINFYKHYLNHMIIYITGATGQGKSTQMPKLFLYALKMLDYKMNGKVLCTQPRIGPTLILANRVSEELGVPICQYSNTLKNKLKSNNYYVQYSHSHDNHLLNKSNYSTIKFTTDGTFITELYKNPLLKNEIIYPNNNLLYSESNKYDIIIIDEAHEHNTNMDLILSFGRISCYFNNSIKLVIMSATMDDDEPNYRSYYKIINDNLVYPLRAYSFNYFDSINKEILYNSIYLDRRLHIAPPNIQTQYNIKEIYIDNINTNTLVQQILNTSTNGDILIFENGINDILKRVQELNTITPPHVITLPYLGNLHQRYKNIIEDLINELPKLRIDKKLVYTKWNENYYESNDVLPETYTRCIIIATNVAEASITIENLKFVIDNGTAKINKYNEIYNISDLLVVPISESSRLQRKGRVGRVSNGTIYYLYKKGALENIKPYYKITLEQFESYFISLLESKQFTTTESNLLLKEYDPNIPNNFISNINKNINDIKNTNYYTYNIYEIHKHQYYTLLNYKEYWDRNYYIYKITNIKECMYYKLSGYEKNNLLDIYGIFYIIHPYENNFKRNIFGKIIEYIDNNNNWIKIIDKIPNYYFNELIKNLSYKYFILNINDELYKTELYENIKKLEEHITHFTLSYNELITLFTSNMYGTLIEVIEIITFIKSIGGTLNKLLINKKIFNNHDNELEYIYNIIKKFKQHFHYLNVFKIINFNKHVNIYTKTINIIINDFIKDKYIYKYNPPPDKYTVNLWDTLNALHNNGNIINGFNYLITSFLNTSQYFYNFLNYTNEITQWCNNNNINSDNIIDFLNNLVKFNLNIFMHENNIFDNLPLQIYSSFKKSLIYNTEIEKIIKPFIHGLPLNIALKVSSNHHYHTCIYPSNTISIINCNIKNSNCIINKEPILFYYSKRINTVNTIDYIMDITNTVRIEWLINILPLYYTPSNFTNTIIRKWKDKEYIHNIYGDLYNLFYLDLSNKWNINNIPYEIPSYIILNKLITDIKKQLISSFY